MDSEHLWQKCLKEAVAKIMLRDDLKAQRLAPQALVLLQSRRLPAALLEWTHPGGFAWGWGWDSGLLYVCPFWNAGCWGSSICSMLLSCLITKAREPSQNAQTHGRPLRVMSTDIPVATENHTAKVRLTRSGRQTSPTQERGRNNY